MYDDYSTFGSGYAELGYMEQENRFVFWTTIIANISVAVGVIFAGYQFWETRQFEKMQNSMELINKLKGRDVVSAYKKILEHKESKNKKT